MRRFPKASTTKSFLKKAAKRPTGAPVNTGCRFSHPTAMAIDLTDSPMCWPRCSGSPPHRVARRSTTTSNGTSFQTKLNCCRRFIRSSSRWIRTGRTCRLRFHTALKTIPMNFTTAACGPWLPAFMWLTWRGVGRSIGPTTIYPAFIAPTPCRWMINPGGSPNMSTAATSHPVETKTSAGVPRPL